MDKSTASPISPDISSLPKNGQYFELKQLLEITKVMKKTKGQNQDDLSCK